MNECTTPEPESTTTTQAHPVTPVQTLPQTLQKPPRQTRLIGLLGGMSWESSALYYRLINERIRERLGGLHSARCVLLSVDFAEIERLQATGAWVEAGTVLATEAGRLEAAGAEAVVLCTNTMHKVAEAIETATTIPLLHLADVAAQAINASGVRTVGLLGTSFTMEDDFYRGRLERHGIRVLVPTADERAIVHRVIFEELVLGIVSEDSRAEYSAIIRSLADRGAEGVVLGCTEIELLISQADSPIPVFPTTSIHVDAAVDFALSAG